MDAQIVDGIRNLNMPMEFSLNFTYEQHMAAYKAASSEFLKKKYLEQLNKQYDDGDIHDVLSQSLKAKLDKKEECKSTWVFITINPKDDSNVDVFISTVHKAVSKKWISEARYVFEQRSELPGVFSGFHCHILIKRGTKPPSQVRNEFNGTFRSLVGSLRHIDFKWATDKTYVNFLKYIEGNKEDGKLSKVNVDKEWRAIKGLRDTYSVPSVDNKKD